MYFHHGHKLAVEFEEEFPLNINLITVILKDESGATAIEYGLIAGLVSVACFLALSAMGDALNALYSVRTSELKSAIN